MLVEMKVSGLSLDPATSTPVLLLRDSGGKNSLSIWIGLTEASSIAMEMEGVELARPMTHDLLRNILGILKVSLSRVVITDLKGNTFFAEMFIRSGESEVCVDSRPSDAIALAIRSKVPIFVDQIVLDKSRRLESQFF